MDYYSGIKKWNFANCRKVNVPKEYYVYWNKLEKEKYYMIALICEIKKNYTNLDLRFQGKSHVHLLI